MRWADLAQLNWLWGLAGFAGLLVWSWRYRRKMLGDFGDPRLVAVDPERLPARAVIFKNFLLSGVFVFAVVALARPQWGFEWREIKRQGIDILVVFDTSRSMLTRDVRPSRMERARLGVHDLVKRLKGDRIGLVAFAGDAFLACPLTPDYAGFRLTLDDLSTDTISRGGTNVGRAIREALEAHKKDPGAHKVIIFITDGENLEGEPLEAAKEARDQGVKIYPVGVGTREGELIQLHGPLGRDEFVRDRQGNFVKSRLNETLLRQIAAQSGGAYLHAGGARFGLDELYEREIARLEKHEFDSRREKRFHERFQIPLALALLLLVVQTCWFYKS
jgi:Ca-activated chloride channel family protein